MKLDLQAFKDSGSLHDRKHFLLCHIGAQVYGFAIEQVREVLTGVRSHPVPFDIEGIKGLVAIRGHICPLVDVGRCLPVGDERLNRSEACLLVCEVKDYRFCIEVNRVIHVIDQTSMTEFHAANQDQLISLVAHVNQELVLFVDLGELIQRIRPMGSDICCH